MMGKKEYFYRFALVLYFFLAMCGQTLFSGTVLVCSAFIFSSVFLLLFFYFLEGLS